MKLRTLLAIASCLVVIPSLVVLSTTIYLTATDRVYGSVDDTLKSRALSIRSSILPAAEPLTVTHIETSRASLDRQAAQGGLFRVVALDGSVLYPPGLEAEVLPTNGVPAQTFRTLEGADGRMRALWAEYISGGNVVGYVEVQESLAAADGAVRDIRTILAIGTVLTAVAMLVASNWIARRITRPIQTVSDLANEIRDASDFSNRLPDVSSPREVGDLKDVLNSLLERIEGMMVEQRAFFAETSHELRRPLTVIRTDIDILRMSGLEQAKRAGLHEDMAIEAEAMSRLIGDLLVLSRGELQSGPVGIVNLSALARASLQRLREYCTDHDLEDEIACGILVRGREDGLAHLIDNLLDNAHQYTPVGGTISLRLRRETSNTVMEVADTGLGMTDVELSNAFDRFARGAEARRIRPEGSGLGLSIVKHFAEAYGGRVELSSAIGKGTTCRVILPTPVDRR